MLRKLLAAIVTAIGVVSIFSHTALSADYPDRPVRIIVPVAAGGGSDILARIIADKLSTMWPQRVFIDNRPGAGHMRGTAIGARSESESLKEIAPGVRRVAVILNPNIPANVVFLRASETAAISLGMIVTAAGVSDAANIESILTAFAREQNGGIIVTPSPVTNTKDNRELIAALADRLSLPTIYPYRLFAASGELISYTYDGVAQWQGAASYVDRILRGAKSAELPVQAPTKYEMIINLKTAKARALMKTRA